MDPQLRIMLEATYEAIQDAGEKDQWSNLLHLNILTYNEGIDHSLLPAWVPVSINFYYYDHCGAGKKIA
jgi:hypothetical protein